MFKLSNTFIALILFISISIIAVSSGVLYINSSYMKSINTQEITLTIPHGSSVGTIANSLEKNGIVKSGTLFELSEMLNSDNRELKPGIYTFQPKQSFSEILNNLKSTPDLKEETTMVTIPEGFTIEQIAERLEENNVCTAKEFLELVKSKPEKDKKYLKNAENYEGFLFPDTYEFFYYSTPSTVLNKFLSEFENKMKNITDLNTDDTIYDKLKIASLLEKEAYHSDEMPKIASVINNRLNADSLLQIDASLLYAIGHKEKISNEDLKQDTPYNLYKYKGLPPTPICNPGLNAIKAAYSPEKTKYMYYSLDTETKYHKFAKTYEEHNKNIEKYLKTNN